MMKNEKACIITRELLPIYIDDIGSGETNKYVEEHLEKCDLCKKEYNKIYKINNNKEAKNKVDTIKKFKRQIILGIILVIVISSICIGLSIFYNKIEFGWSNIFEKENWVIIILNIGSYLIPLFALLFCWIWRKASIGSSSYDISTGFFISILILMIFRILNLVYNLTRLASFYGLL